MYNRIAGVFKLSDPASEPHVERGPNKDYRRKMYLSKSEFRVLFIRNMTSAALTLWERFRRFPLLTSVPTISTGDEIEAKLELALAVAFPTWLVALILGDSFVFVRKVAPTAIILAILCAQGVSLYLARRGHARLGAWIVLANCWILATAAVWLAGGLSNIIPIYYIVLISGAGWLLSRQAAALFAVMSCAALAVMAVLDTWVPGRPHFFALPPPAALLVFAVAITLFAVPLLLILESISLTRESLSESESQTHTRAAQLQATMDAAPAMILVAHDAECRHITGNQTAYLLLRQPSGSNLSMAPSNEARPRHYRWDAEWRRDSRFRIADTESRIVGGIGPKLRVGRGL